MKRRKIRIVLNPSYWNGNITGHSISLSAIDTAKALSRMEHLHVILPVPEDDKTWRYTEEELEGIDQIVKVKYSKKYMTHFATEDWWKHFNVGNGDVYYDAMLEFNSRQALTEQHTALVGNYRTKFFFPSPMRVAWIARPLFLSDELSNKPLMHMQEILAQATMPTLFLTDHAKQVSMGAARKYVSPALLRDVDQRTGIVPHSIDIDRVHYKPRRNPDKVRLMFGTSFDTVKQPDKIAEMWMKAATIRKPIECVVSVPCRKTRDWEIQELKDRVVKLFPFGSEVHVGPPRKVYEELLEGSDVFVCMSKYESFGLSYFEQLQAGQVGIYLKQPWMKNVLPKEYPYICETEEEVYARLLWVIDNLEEAQKQVAFMKDWIAENISKKAVAEKIADFVGDLVEKNIEEDKAEMQDQWLYKCLEGTLKRDSYTMKELAEIVKQEKKTNIFVNSTPYSHTVRRMMQILGFDDTLNKDGMPAFRRRETK